MRRPRIMIAVSALALSVCCLFPLPPAPAAAEPEASAPRTATGWHWPLRAFSIAQGFRAPAHEYGPGHRGIDLAPDRPDRAVRAPAAGRIAFAGRVAGRGVVTIDVAGGLVVTLEPVTPTVTAGQSIAGGAVVATQSVGGHAEPGTVHFGVRRDGRYINPLVMLGGVPRAVLLPCCS